MSTLPALPIQQFSVSRDDSIYEAFPDVALATDGTLVCVISECTHHSDRSFTRIAVTRSTDRGESWSPKRELTPPLVGGESDPYWNCARISILTDGRLVALVDRIGRKDERNGGEIVMTFSDDAGATWGPLIETPITGIVPDQLIELKLGKHAGRWLVATHEYRQRDGKEIWSEELRYSDDQGKSWSEPVVITVQDKLKLCEASIVELPGGELVAFYRENSGLARDAYKCLSHDGGETWTEPVEFPVPGCHRPVAAVLADGRVMMSYRYSQGGNGWLGWWTQNTMLAFTDIESCLAEKRGAAHTRLVPLAHDRSAESDCGYTGWVQFEDGEVYVVNYLLDDAPKAQICGYRFHPDDLFVPLPS